jgi:hypothetical protein
MGQTVFTRAEAQAKVGLRFRIRTAFAGVPHGAIGPPAARAAAVSWPTRTLSR